MDGSCLHRGDCGRGSCCRRNGSTAGYPAEASPAFEAATIRPAAPGAVFTNHIRPTSPNRLFIPGITLAELIYAAYGDGGFNTSMRVTGGPDWVNRTAFSIEAVTPAHQCGRGNSGSCCRPSSRGPVSQHPRFQSWRMLGYRSKGILTSSMA